MTSLHTVAGGPSTHKNNDADPYKIMQGFVKKYPGKPRKFYIKKYVELSRDDEDYRDWNDTYSAENILNSVLRLLQRSGPEDAPLPPKPVTEVEREIKRVEVQERKIAREVRAETVVQKFAEIVIAGFVLPNGKAFRECTGGYLVDLGGKFACVGKKVKHNQVIGKVLTDHQMQVFWET